MSDNMQKITVELDDDTAKMFNKIAERCGITENELSNTLFKEYIVKVYHYFGLE